MSRAAVDLSRYRNAGFDPGASLARRAAWHLVSAAFFESCLPGSAWKAALLRAFGARVGRGVVIKPAVKIKAPWRLRLGDHVWIGEQAWIDNLVDVAVGSHCCISQGALLLTGNHDYRSPAFDLRAAPIALEDGVWIGARAVVCPGIRCGSHSVLAVNSVATRDLDAYGVYQGNPAARVRERTIGGA